MGDVVVVGSVGEMRLESDISVVMKMAMLRLVRMFLCAQ